MGVYYLYAIDHNGRPAYQHKSGLDYLFYAEGNAWVIGAQVVYCNSVTNFHKGMKKVLLKESSKFGQ